MDIDNCHHEWNYDQHEYLPVVESIKKHHACKDCGLINNRHYTTQLKTGKLIGLIKEILEKNDIPRSQIRDHTEMIKQMKRDGVNDNIIIHTVLSEVGHQHNSDNEYRRWY
ncbi:hypothetical protein [Methanococcoides sp. LMO-2]|uniref:Uncharacterized protein n=1 Tax=Methanococcoides cohabitans TaxID=3136559 RepID=A0ABU9KRV1_9EURY